MVDEPRRTISTMVDQSFDKTRSVRWYPSFKMNPLRSSAAYSTVRKSFHSFVVDHLRVMSEGVEIAIYFLECKKISGEK